MRDLAGFREAVEQYRKQVGRTEEELARELYISKGELNKCLHDYSHPQSQRTWRLQPGQVKSIVETLARWGAITARKQAFALFTLIDLPALAEEIDWQAPPWSRLHLGASQRDRQPSLPVSHRLFQARDLPQGYVPRPKAFNEIKRLLLNRESQRTTAITTALRGAGGFGKTTLALAFCHDSEIQAAFPDGIWWIELGEQPPRTLDLLNRLLASLEPSQTDAVLLQEAQERWRIALRSRACLLVIDDVWQAEALLPLLEGGPQCVRLITTRNDLLLPKNAARVLVDAMELQEAVILLCRGLPEDIHQAVYQPNLEALAARLGRWPLLLTLANGLLTDLVDAHLSLAEALATVAEAYETRGVTAFRLDNVEERQRTVDACLKVSLQHLETFTHPDYHAAERYQELAVFPKDTDIPLATLQVYWKGSAGLEPWETKDLCIRLHRLSLLLTCDLGAGTIRLHDVVRSYLIQRAGEQVPALHQLLLQAYQQHYHLNRWAELPESEGYLWHRLIYHLCQADNQEAIQTTLTDLLYVTHKVLYLGVGALEDDLVLATTSSPHEDVGHPSPQVASLHRTIMRFHHLLQQVSTEAEIGGLLLSILKEEESLATQRRALEQELPRPFLTAWHPLPHTFSNTLLRTLSGHTSSVRACAYSPDSKWIVSASHDRTLKVWEVVSGAELRTLRDQIAPVWACGYSPDGKWIVSASHVGMLKVWEVVNGAELCTLSGHTDWVSACGYSPDGKFIVSASHDCTLEVYVMRTSTVGRIPHNIHNVDSDRSVAQEGFHIMWKAATGAKRLTLRGHTGSVNACGFSPDGKWIVSASSDHTLKVWEAATGAELRTLRDHIAPVWGCGFSPDGKWIVSASDDKTLKVWEVRTGRCLITFPVDRTLHGCAWHPDGEHLIAWGDGGMYFLRLVQEARLEGPETLPSKGRG